MGDEETYCLCRRPYHPSEFMIECDVCKDWFHGSCVGIEEHQSSDIETYHCPNCQPEHGPLTLKRRRNWHRHDYSELNDGSKAVQSGTVVFVNKLKQKKFLSGDDILLKIHGSDLTPECFEQHGFKQPILVKQKEGLKLRVPPPEFRIIDVERYVGSMREVDVIDVSRQEDIRMKMREWTEYYENQPRRKILNVISLEFSDSDLSRLVSPPGVVRKIDWIEKHWPDTLPEDSPLSRPEVQKYCLMSVKDSYTDFHVDFGGTSVWYHVIWGEKIFYMIPPTDENLIKYENWVMSSNQSEVFFGDLVPECYMCKLMPGNTFFIPTGWIHAVLTPQDSLVFGGNFLHRYNIAMQLRINEMEHRLDTPLRFLHPCYEALNWFAARDLLGELKDHHNRGTVPPQYLLEGLQELAFSFSSWTRTKETLKVHRNQIPPDIKHARLIEQITRAVARFKAPIQPARDKPEGLKSHVRRRSGSDREGEVPHTERRRAIKMKLSTSGSRVTGHSEDEEQRISMKFSLPQATVVSSSVGGGESDSDVSVGRGDETYQPMAEDVFSTDEEEELGDPRVDRRGRERERKNRKGEWESEGSEGEKEYEDDDFIYPSLVNESEAASGDEDGRDGCGVGLPPGGRKRKTDKDDDLWTPQGPVKLIKDSIASSPRLKRNARKRSFEQSLSATAAKIHKLEQDRKASEFEQVPTVTEVKPKPSLLPEVRPTDPVLGGGSLRGTGVGSTTGEGEEESAVPSTKRARATAAATAVDAVLAASRPKSKPLTAKQRLGKLLGLNRGGRWKK